MARRPVTASAAGPRPTSRGATPPGGAGRRQRGCPGSLWADPSATGGSRGRRKSCPWSRSEEHTSELQSQSNLVCRLLLEKKKSDTGSPVDKLRLDIGSRKPSNGARQSRE